MRYKKYEETIFILWYGFFMVLPMYVDIQSRNK